MWPTSWYYLFVFVYGEHLITGKKIYDTELDKKKNRLGLNNYFVIIYKYNSPYTNTIVWPKFNMRIIMFGFFLWKDPDNWLLRYRQQKWWSAYSLNKFSNNQLLLTHGVYIYIYIYIYIYTAKKPLLWETYKCRYEPKSNPIYFYKYTLLCGVSLIHLYLLSIYTIKPFLLSKPQ